MWRSLVARVVRDDEVAGSNPVIPTDSPGHGFMTGALSYLQYFAQILHIQAAPTRGMPVGAVVHAAFFSRAQR